MFSLMFVCDGGGVVLYKQGPPFYHATYSVIVKLVDSDASVSNSWTSLSGLNRITQHVAKVTASVSTHLHYNCSSLSSLLCASDGLT